MRLKSLILGCALLLTPSIPAAAKERAPEAAKVVQARPALWMVKDADTTIYLFGTIHLLKPDMQWFQGPIRTAYETSQEIVLEVAETEDKDAQAKVMKRALAIDAPTLTSRLSESAREKYLAALDSHGLAHILFDRVKPWFATLTLSVLPLKNYGFDPDNGADHVIKLAAIADGKTLTGLESSDEQIGFFEDLPDDLQIRMLTQTLDELPKLGETIDRMIGAWAGGEPDKLAALMNESVDSTPELEKRLLTDRNDRWADWIKLRMDKPGTVLVAVGAGHLAGDKSVQAMLAQRGLKAKRVKQIR